LVFGKSEKMKKRVAGLLFAGLASSAVVSAQVVPVGGMGQHIIARNVAGIDCTTGQQTGFGTAELWFPYIAGIPSQYLFLPGATVHNETTAVITAVFSKVELSQYQNFDMTDVFLKSHAINYYYHPNSAPKDWTDFDGFQAGTLIATYQVQMNMFTVAKGISLVINSGPFTYSTDFTLPDGTRVNLQNLMPGGITVIVMGELGSPVTDASGKPVVIDARTSKGPFTLGSCAVMSPFSGSGVNPSNENSNLQIKGLDKPGGEAQ
jgi:hypothetical protein